MSVMPLSYHKFRAGEASFDKVGGGGFQTRRYGLVGAFGLACLWGLDPDFDWVAVDD